MSNQYRELKSSNHPNLLRECARSGKNKQEWCVQAGVKYPILMRWQGLLRGELAGILVTDQRTIYRSTAPSLPVAAYDDLPAFKIYLISGGCGTAPPADSTRTDATSCPT